MPHVGEPISTSPAFDDEEAFTAFYRETASSLHRHILKQVGDPMLADDVLQLSYLRLLRAPSMDDGHRRAYLYRAAGSLIIDKWRETRRAKRTAAALTSIEPGDVGPEPRRELFRLVEGLGRREFELLWLTYAAGYSHKEIGAIFKVGEGSVRVLLFRARNKARKILMAEDEEAGP